MIILITGASHTGKTVLAQRMLEKYGYPYMSVDHLKMGLIRSGYLSKGVMCLITGELIWMKITYPISDSYALR